MAKQPRKAPAYPQDLLDDVAWSFSEPPCPTLAAFTEAVRAYNQELDNEGSWRPDEVVLRCPRVRVTVEYWDDPGELVAELAADRAEGFTAGELLFKVHNAFSPQLSQGDHHFFEGFTRVKRKNADPNEPPAYEVMTGS